MKPAITALRYWPDAEPVGMSLYSIWEVDGDWLWDGGWKERMIGVAGSSVCVGGRGGGEERR